MFEESLQDVADAVEDVTPSEADDAVAEAVVGEDVEAQLAELKNQLLRVHADFDNFRKRTRQEKEDLQQFATKKVMEELLPIVDNFERALSSLPTAEDDHVRTGVEMVYRQLGTLLERYGVTPYESVLQPFDPELHEAVLQEPAGDGEPGTVTEELQRGYKMHGKVLRASMVKVTV